jgi:GTPase SAR1 family protein
MNEIIKDLFLLFDQLFSSKMTNTKQTGGAIQKIIFLGDSGVGKSSLIFRYVDKIFTQDYFQTIGGKNKIHEQNGMTMKFQF